MKNYCQVSTELDLFELKVTYRIFAVELNRPRKRISELMLRHSNFKSSEMFGKQWELLFFRTPKKITASDTNEVNGIVFGLNRLEGNNLENPIVVDTGEEETTCCGILVKSIGYKSLPLAEELPFDHARGVIRQTEGRVDGMPGCFCVYLLEFFIKLLILGVYCSGWVASGPTGVIASTLQSGHDVGRRILLDLTGEKLQTSGTKLGSHKILPSLHAKGVSPVTFIQWEKLDQEEQERGKQLHKPREKIVDVKEMLDIIQKT